MQETLEQCIKIEDQDYGHALLHLTWLEGKDTRDLVLAMVEMIPAEIPHTSPPDIQDKLTLSDQKLYHERRLLSFGQALEWYETFRKGEPVQTKDREPVSTAMLGEEPSWPKLLTSYEIPLSPSQWGCVRGHLMLSHSPTKSVIALLENAKATPWLADRWFFNPLEYPEYLCGGALILPNPVLRGIEQKMGKLPDGRETSDFRFITRAGKSVEGLTLNIVERRPFGRCDLRNITLTSPYLRVHHGNDVQQTALELISTEYGLLDWQEPAGYLRELNVELGISYGTKNVTVPAIGKRPAETYEQTVYGPGAQIKEGDPPPHNADLMSSLYRQKHQRTQRAEAKRLGQEWFHGNQQEAVNFVRGLIGRARNRVWIIDPYFASVDLFRFALATKRSDVETLIITSAECLSKDDGIDQTRSAGQVLQDQLANLPGQCTGSIDIKVMTGDKPEVHDRFLVIDDVVWLSGNSLNNIGERAGMMIKLPYPAPIIESLQQIQTSERTIDLAEWNRRKAEGGET